MLAYGDLRNQTGKPRKGKVMEPVGIDTHATCKFESA